MAEYRNGNFAAADEVLKDAVMNNKNVRFIVTAKFYRAMSLFRQDKQDEARELALAAAAKMRPLPSDRNKPLAAKAVVSDMVAWLAYKEARSIIKFSAAAKPAAAE